MWLASDNCIWTTNISPSSFVAIYTSTTDPTRIFLPLQTTCSWLLSQQANSLGYNIFFFKRNYLTIEVRNTDNSFFIHSLVCMAGERECTAWRENYQYFKHFWVIPNCLPRNDQSYSRLLRCTSTDPPHSTYHRQRIYYNQNIRCNVIELSVCEYAWKARRLIQHWLQNQSAI